MRFIDGPEPQAVKEAKSEAERNPSMVVDWSLISTDTEEAQIRYFDHAVATAKELIDDSFAEFLQYTDHKMIKKMLRHFDMSKLFSENWKKIRGILKKRLDK